MYDFERYWVVFRGVLDLWHDGEPMSSSAIYETLSHPCLKVSIRSPLLLHVKYLSCDHRCFSYLLHPLQVVIRCIWLCIVTKATQIHLPLVCLLLSNSS